MSKTTKTETKPSEQYDHEGKERCNNPLVGLICVNLQLISKIDTSTIIYEEVL